MDTRLQKEKPKQAIALAYDPEEDAPKVIASGRGQLAEKIIEKGEKEEVRADIGNNWCETEKQRGNSGRFGDSCYGWYFLRIDWIHGRWISFC